MTTHVIPIFYNRPKLNHDFITVESKIKSNVTIQIVIFILTF